MKSLRVKFSINPQKPADPYKGTSASSVNLVVGAPGFEPGASCAQGRRNISWKSFLFNLNFENKRVRKIFGSGTMYGNVAPHA